MSVFNEIFPCHRCLKIGVLNLMPSCDREATEGMFKRRFAAFHLPVEIVWLHPHADQESFKHTNEIYHVPSAEIYGEIDYLFRTGANAAFIKPEENQFLQCLRESREFRKGSTSFCWSAIQTYADETGQQYSDFLIGKDSNGDQIKRAGYFYYQFNDAFPHLDHGRDTYMACSRYSKIDARKQGDIARANGFKAFAISEFGFDIAGFIKGNDILLFTHPDYGPDRLPYEFQRNMSKPDVSESQRSALQTQFKRLQSGAESADILGQKIFDAILMQAKEAKYGVETMPETGPAPEARLAVA